GESLLERAIVKARVRAVDQLYLGASGTFQLTHQGRVRLSELKQTLQSSREREPFGILWDVRHWEQDLYIALLKASSSSPVSVACMDMNGLKALNDEHDHDAGDRGLRMYFRAVAAVLGDKDQAYRIGGDEVLTILPSCDVDQAAERLELACRRLMHDSLNA